MIGRPLKIAVLKGDGIGPEVVGSAIEVLQVAAKKNALTIELEDLPIGIEAYRQKGRTLPPETLEGMRESEG